MIKILVSLSLIAVLLINFCTARHDYSQQDAIKYASVASLAYCTPERILEGAC